MYQFICTVRDMTDVINSVDERSRLFLCMHATGYEHSEISDITHVSVDIVRRSIQHTFIHLNRLLPDFAL